MRVSHEQQVRAEACGRAWGRRAWEDDEEAWDRRWRPTLEEAIDELFGEHRAGAAWDADGSPLPEELRTDLAESALEEALSAWWDRQEDWQDAREQREDELAWRPEL